MSTGRATSKAQAVKKPRAKVNTKVNTKASAKADTKPTVVTAKSAKAPNATSGAAPDKPKSIAKHTAGYQRVALMLQGGGALGSYQVGVYKALAQADCHPSWVCGVSIGAINGAIIAGNPPAKRVERLEEFWSLITSRPGWPSSDVQAMQPMAQMTQMAQMGSALAAMVVGQPGFFSPRMVNPWLGMSQGDAATSLYDSSQLRETLLRLVDFDLLNSGATRLSVGAVHVPTGNQVYFDTAKERIEPEHIMASGALPPALPMVTIKGEQYWDGGIVSNTPLQYLLDQDEDLSTLVFQVDLFGALGKAPQTMPQVLARQKDITYSSRTRQASSAFKRILALRHQLADALQRVPANRLRPGEAALMRDYADAGVVKLVQLIYQSKGFESDSKDYEFSRASMLSHVEAGYADTAATLVDPRSLERPTDAQGVAEYDLHRRTK
jgi:NTE family protein